MKINDFKLERYFADYEFKAKYLLSSSDCESLELTELLQMADPESLELWHKLKLGYTETKGHPLLRREISNLYNDIKSEDIIVLGPEEGIFIALNVMLDPGDHVIVSTLRISHIWKYQWQSGNNQMACLP
jgi:DNA-binding transcriptional MocR family regulator